MERAKILAFAYKFWATLDTPRSLACFVLAKYGEIEQLVNLTCLPQHYVSAHQLRKDRLATDLLRKAEFLDAGLDPEKAAFIKWLSAEASCAALNRDLLNCGEASGRLIHAKPLDPYLHDTLNQMQTLIADVLGPLPKGLPTFGGFTNGAALGITRRHCDVISKITTQEPTLHATALGHLPGLPAKLKESLARVDKSIRLCIANRLSFVPKTCKTHRAIAVEPLLSVPLQRSLGEVIRGRLQRRGIDLLHGQDHHQKLARDASVNGRLATIDLSSASDTISYRLVRRILPQDWLAALESLRSTHSVVPERFRGAQFAIDNEYLRLMGEPDHTETMCIPEDGVMPLSKFSSMGNGYTFELETLIFYAAGYTAMKRSALPVNRYNLTVYGDDIIIDARAVPELSRILNNLGFQVNEDKTFTEGPFRESCGGDYFNGCPTKGFFVKTFDDTPWDYFYLHNSLSLYLDDVPDFRHLQNWCRKQVPTCLRKCEGPPVLGDVCFWSDRPTGKTTGWIRYFYTYQPATRRIFKDPEWSERVHAVDMLAAALLGVRTEGPMVPRSGIGSIRLVPQS